MNVILMLLGTLILTFWVSRAFLTALRFTSLTVKQQLLLGHAASLALIGLFVLFAKAFDIYAPFAYVPAQLIWLGLLGPAELEFGGRDFERELAALGVGESVEGINNARKQKKIRRQK